MDLTGLSERIRLSKIRFGLWERIRWVRISYESCACMRTGKSHESMLMPTSPLDIDLWFSLYCSTCSGCLIWDWRGFILNYTPQ